MLLRPFPRSPSSLASLSSSSSSSSFSLPLFSSVSSYRTMSSSQSKPKPFSLPTLNQNVINAQYAVRGEIPIRAEEIKDQLNQNKNRDTKDGSDFAFDAIVNCNIGNPQQLGQRPITFIRQITSLTDYPPLLTHPSSSSIFPPDVIKRAKKLLEEIGSVGAYSHSKGVGGIRKRVARFLEERDGFPSDPESIYLTAGASTGVSNILQLLISSPSSGVLIPIPQYPLYTATLSLLNGTPIPYYLNESKAWGLDVDNLKHILEKARKDGIEPKAIVVINPGNPTGQCLSEGNLKDVLKFAWNEGLTVLADEVYQNNVYPSPHSKTSSTTSTESSSIQHPTFISFRKALLSLSEPYKSSIPLVSFHSISKGQTGECGRRGGYFDLTNISSKVQEQVYKLASIQLCPPLSGQIAVDCMVDPPKEGEESYKLWKEEVVGIGEDLKERSLKLWKAFSELEGVECNPAEGAMYLFPRLHLPSKFLTHCSIQNPPQTPDTIYCRHLLEKTGICVVPGSGFGQKDGEWHFRTTFLASGTEEYVRRLKGFHEAFMNEWR